MPRTYDLIDFSKLTATLEPYGTWTKSKNYILKIGINPESPVSREYLQRAVVTLLNYGAIDFIPEAGIKEYENLRPYNGLTDDYAMLQTSARRLKKALDTLGYVNLAWAADILCEKRDKKAPKARTKGKRTPTPFWQEVQKQSLMTNKLAFKTVSREVYSVSPGHIHRLGNF